MKKITRSQKCYFAALGVGLGALLLDQTFGSAPPASPRSALSPLSDHAAEGPPSSPLSAVPLDATTAVFDHRLAEQLAALAGRFGATDGSRDGFAPSAAWRPDHNGAPGERAQKFRQNHVLKAVVSDARHPQAMVDNQLVAVGQAVDGFTLINVQRMRAIFSDGQDRIDLTLAGAPGRATP